MKFIIVIISFISLTSSAQSINKKNVLLNICKKYIKEDAIIINQSNNAFINSYLTKSDSLKDYLLEMPTVVHECYHNYLSSSSNIFSGSIINFVIHDSLAFKIPNLKTFPSRELVSFIPQKKAAAIFRFKTYINSTDKLLTTQQFGILGLLDECTAYYHSFKTSVALYRFIEEKYGWSDPDIWVTYLQKISSYRYAMYEFSLFISWYMQYAKMHHIKVYNNIVNNRGIKQIYTFLNNENQRLTQQYKLQRDKILYHLKDEVYIEGNFLYNSETLVGVGLADDKCNLMISFLKEPEHAILNLLLK